MENSYEFLFKDKTPKWFVVIDENTEGPITAKQVCELIEGKQITLSNFAWREGQDDWKRISEIKEFEVLLPQKPQKAMIGKVVEATKSKIVPPPIPNAKKVYFLNINKTQYGPFSKDEIKVFIERKKIHARSWIWKEGMPEWGKLGDVSEFAKCFVDAAPTKEEKKDSRKNPRKPLTAKILFHNEKTVHIGMCRDISLGGMQILTDKVPGKIGEKIKLNINPTGTKLKSFVAEGEIVRVLENLRGFSFRFTKLDDKTTAAIEEYIGG